MLGLRSSLFVESAILRIPISPTKKYADSKWLNTATIELLELVSAGYDLGEILMQIWVDGDACPVDVKELLFRAAKRREVMVTLVANQPLFIPKSKFIAFVLVPGGANVADQKIVEMMAAKDLVITADIPLAASVVEKGGQALNPRGELYTDGNIGERLAVRDLLDDLRGGGLVTGGPSNFGPKERQAFANQLDQWVTKAKLAEEK